MYLEYKMKTQKDLFPNHSDHIQETLLRILESNVFFFSTIICMNIPLYRWTNL